MLTYLGEFDDYYTYHEDEHPFVECATFADDYKYSAAHWQAEQHYIDTPYLDLGGKESDFDVVYNADNITQSIDMLVQWLSLADDGTDYLTSYVYQNLTGQFDDENVARSYALRLLIHYVGDVHQPFHCMDKYDAENIDGDRGGNDFKLPSHYGSSNLHSVWDHLIYTQHVSIARPFTPEAWTDFQPTVTEFVARNAEIVSDASSYENFDYFGWSDESYNIGITKYDGIEQNVALPQWYIDENLPITEQRVVLAGYRLAYLIEYIYPSTQLFLQ